MPSKNEIKIYIKDGIYHAYNRGVNKDQIFLDDKDYSAFLYLLERYLLPTPKNEPKRTKNFSDDVKLLAFCLMPNHFHLLLKQKTERAMPGFLRSLLISYSMRFNKKYHRIGPLFQSRYKARLIESEKDLATISKYIHQNPLEITKDLEEYLYSSFSCYVGMKNNYRFIDCTDIMVIFDNNRNLYRKYVLDQI